MKKAITIAGRYAATRVQFSTDKGPENLIFDYGTHKQRLIPILAGTFAIHFTAKETQQIYDKLMFKINQVKNSNDPEFKSVIESLKETHATAAGLKAFST